MAEVNCLDNKLNIGLTDCKVLPEQIKGMITTPRGFVMPAEDVDDPAAWQAAIQEAKGTRIYLWPSAVNIEVVSEDTVYEETSLRTMKVRDGRYRLRLMFVEALCTHRQMFSHNASDGGSYLIDAQDKILGWTNSDGDFAPYTIGLLNTEKLMLSDGSIKTKTPVYLELANNRQLDQFGKLVQADFVNELVPLSDVKLTLISASATEIVVTVKRACDGVPARGLVVADFTFAGGTLLTATEAPAGTYTFTGVGLTTGALDLVTTDNMSVPGYESTGPVTATIA